MADRVIRAALERRGTVVGVREELLSPPDLPVGALPYWRAFFELDAHRGVIATFAGNMEPRLSYVDVSQYARDHGWADDEATLDTFMTMMRAMDAVWVAHHNSKQVQAATPPPPTVG